MSYRIRFTMPNGRTGLWTPTYATREAAQQAIDDRMADTGLAYAVEEVATPEDLAASRQGPAKVSGGAGGTAHTGPGHQSGAGQGVASRLIVDLDAIEQEGTAKASEAPGEGGDSGEGAK